MELTKDNREKIKSLAMAMRELPQLELKTDHYFADGMYIRSVFRPAGAVIVGKVHKKEHFYIIVSGCVDVTSGGEVVRHHAPYIVVSKPGTQRAVFAVEDSLCMTVHRTDNTNLDEIEKELVEPCDYALLGSDNKLLEVQS